MEKKEHYELRGNIATMNADGILCFVMELLHSDGWYSVNRWDKGTTTTFFHPHRRWPRSVSSKYPQWIFRPYAEAYALISSHNRPHY